MNKNVYVVVSGTSKSERQDIVKIFDTEEKAQNYIDGLIIEWLKNQKKFDPDHTFSGEVEYGYECDEYYVTLDIRKDGYYSYFDILTYDYN